MANSNTTHNDVMLVWHSSNVVCRMKETLLFIEPGYYLYGWPSSSRHTTSVCNQAN